VAFTATDLGGFMTKKRDGVPYGELERRALRDLAQVTIATPDAPSEHVEAATRRLSAPTGKPEIGNLSTLEKFTLETLLKKARGAVPCEPIAIVAILDCPGVATCLDCGGTCIAPPEAERSLDLRGPST
jgi:hypothetical protein